MPAFYSSYDLLQRTCTFIKTIKELLISYAEKNELKNGTVMWPARIAASGQTVTPGGAVEILDILGKDETLRRLNIGLEKLS